MRGCSGGVCVVAPGGHVWFYLGGHAWFYLGGHAWFYLGVCAWFYLGGACMVLFGGPCMVLFRGVCVVLFGGVCGFIWGGMRGFFTFFGYNEIRSMSGQYASYWNAFLFCFVLLLIYRNNKFVGKSVHKINRNVFQ